MDRFNFLLPAIITFMTSLLGQSLVGAEAIDAKIDVVVLIDNKDNDITRQLKSSLQMVPEYFTLGPDNARLAIVQGPMDDVTATPDNNRWVLMNLGADPSLYERTMENFTLANNGGSEYIAFWGRTLDSVRAEIFGHTDSTNSAKVAIIIMSQPGADQLEDKAKAQTLRDAGSWVYIVAMDDLHTRVTANEMAADPNRVVIASGGAVASSVGSVARVGSFTVTCCARPWYTGYARDYVAQRRRFGSTSGRKKEKKREPDSTARWRSKDEERQGEKTSGRLRKATVDDVVMVNCCIDSTVKMTLLRVENLLCCAPTM